MPADPHVKFLKSSELQIAVGRDDRIELAFAMGERLPTAAMLYVHGFGSRRNGEKALALAEACKRAQLTFAAFDFRGHGNSTGTILELTGGRLLEDMEAAVAELGRQGIRYVCPVGSSMGGWVSAWFTLMHLEIVPACVAIAPAFDFIRLRWSRLTDAERRAWKETGRHHIQNSWIDTEIGYAMVEEIDRYPYDRLCKEWSKPLLIFHGLNDETIGHSHSLAFAEKCSQAEVELRLLKNGDHRLSQWKDEIAAEACRFFQKHLDD